MFLKSTSQLASLIFKGLFRWLSPQKPQQFFLMNNPTLSPDTQAILLLCSQLSNSSPDVKPFDLSEYNQLETWLQSQNRTPQDLFTVTKNQSQRISALLKQGLLLSLSLEKWTSQDIWILTRRDPQYPQQLLQQKKEAAPIILYGIGNKKLLSQQNIQLTSSVPDVLNTPTISVLKKDLATTALIKHNRDYIKQGLLSLISATAP